jgi:hypothetical protein
MVRYIKDGLMNCTKPIPIKIAFVGPSGSGKSTASTLAKAYLEKEMPLYWICECNVAKPLHLMQRKIYEVMGVIDIKSRNQDGELLQYLAAKFEKELGPKYIEEVDNIVSAYQGKVVCINSDCRNNSYKYLKENGFIFVRIGTDDNIIAERLPNRKDITKADSKKSVEGIDQIEIDHLISNNGTLGELNSSVKLLIKKIIPTL